MTDFLVEALYFQACGDIPNHPTLPVLWVRGVFGECPAQIESIFNQNGWLNSWTNGVFSYHHYHSNSHEVLGVLSGRAELMLGGVKGKKLNVETGDVILLPAGTGHKKCWASPDFRVVGAYPNGQTYDTCSGGTEKEVQAAMQRIKQVPLPLQDPMFGRSGPVFEFWKNSR
ncbi:uncharacterized protein YjlB [Paenibacillus shirakamiensis]|uniref:Uncharacterized protein YjlB n=1 Tax=Paenibacillus shirakamiensis TaxID=1265935 RepID=A0ABS4JJQ7_9BACL|nr:cupin domain-containing protein [Paenibacillus shirakamiensis]MBP2001939.1 uncharacterized protein YjlB [Paenibacillus shirakamiensis]